MSEARRKVRRALMALLCASILAAVASRPAAAQSFALGAHVSFLARCEQDRVVFKENGKPVDVLDPVREHGYNWVRLRISHDPAAAPDKLPNDLRGRSFFDIDGNALPVIAAFDRSAAP